MNVLDGFKTLYTAGGGQENLDELQGNKDQNMHSVIYGDGLDTTLPSNIENDVLSIAKGGGGLPEVTSEDNGNVLTVVNGKWAKAEPGGGSSIKLYVTDPPTTDPGVSEDWVADENISKGLSNTPGGDALTISELKEIIDSYDTISVVFFDDDEGTSVYNPISLAYINENLHKAVYIEIFTSASPVTVAKVGAGFAPGQA